MEPEKRSELVSRGKELKDQLAGLEADLSKAQDAMQREGQRLPNLAHPEASQYQLTWQHTTSWAIALGHSCHKLRGLLRSS